MSATTVLVPLAEGFEEIEAIVPVDVWRRAGYDVVTAGLEEGPVTAARKTRHLPDLLFRDVANECFDLIYIPGGRPGADHLAASEALLELLARQVRDDRWIACICAAALVLDKAQLLTGRKVTCHPAACDELKTAKSCGERLVVDGKLVSGQGAGVAYELALEVVRQLSGETAVGKICEGLIYPLPAALR